MVYTIKINTIKVLNSKSKVIIRIKGEHLLYSKISGEDDRLWMGECLLYSKCFLGGNIYYIVKYPGGRVTM